jgi:hypothetical protein
MEPVRVGGDAIRVRVARSALLLDYVHTSQLELVDARRALEDVREAVISALEDAGRVAPESRPPLERR